MSNSTLFSSSLELPLPSSFNGAPVYNLTGPQVVSTLQAQPSLPGGVAGQNSTYSIASGAPLLSALPQVVSTLQPQSSVGGVSILNLTPQHASTLLPQSSLYGVAGQNYNPSFPIFCQYPSNTNYSAIPTASQSNPGMNANYNTYPSNTKNSDKPTANESIREIKRHLAILETPTSDAKPKQAEINLLIGEIKPKVNSLKCALMRDDFGYFSSKLDCLLKQIELNTSRPSFGELSTLQLQSYLNFDGVTVSELCDLLVRNVFLQNIDSRLKLIQNNSNRIIALLAAQLDCILSIKFNQYIRNSNLLKKNLKVIIVSKIEAILNLISKVLNCLEHSASNGFLADETLFKLMENLLPFEMLETKKKSNVALFTLHNPTSYANIKSILPCALFWSASKWFVSPTALLVTSLKLIRELTFEASVTNDSIINKYLFLLNKYDFVYNNEQQSKDKNLALQTFCQDFGSLIKQMSNVELDERRLDVILLDIYSLSQHDPGFKLLKPFYGDVAMFNLLALITNQFGERIQGHFALVDREVEKQSAELGDSNKVWLFNHLKSLRNERKRKTCHDSSEISTFASALPDLQSGEDEDDNE